MVLVLGGHGIGDRGDLDDKGVCEEAEDDNRRIFSMDTNIRNL